MILTHQLVSMALTLSRKVAIIELIATKALMATHTVTFDDGHH